MAEHVPGTVHARRHARSHYTVCGEATDKVASVVIPEDLARHPDVTCGRCREVDAAADDFPRMEGLPDAED